MRTFLTLLSLGIAVIGLTPSQARGQMAGDPINGYVQGGQPAGVTPFQTRLPSLWPGNVWLEANLADNGLGYSGAYMSLGAKSRLFEDWFDGRWVLQTQGNISLDRGGLFTNLGLERVFTVDAAGSDVFAGAWYDYDDDQQGDFGHTFHQLGLSGGIRSKYWDAIGNAYLPSGETSHFQGDPTNASTFFRNSIVTQVGFDSALQGFDANLVMRPEILSFVNGNVGIGGYAYQSDAIDTFAGISGRVGIQTLRGLLTSIQINHDERFDTTAVLQVGWIFGARGSRTEYSPIGRDLEPTLRNDHIVRTQQDLLLAIDPDTNNPYVVFHVDNTAAPGGDGSLERPFQTLAQAQAASGPQNIIYVHQGDGTTTGMDQGIVLKDGQLFLGDGIVHTIPVVGGTFDIFNTVNGSRPIITNLAGAAITVADDNTIRNFDIDGNSGLMTHAIFGDGGAGTLTDGIIEDVQVFGNPLLDAISLTKISGDWSFARNDIRSAGRDGIFIDQMTGANSTLTFLNNEVSGNLRDGIHVQDFDGDQFVFDNNTTDGNIRNGLHLQDYVGTNATFDITDHNAAGNSGFGVHLQNIDGDVTVSSPSLVGNTLGGIQTLDVTGDTLITGATVTGNGTGIRNELNGGTQNLTITNSLIEDNNLGIFSQAAGVGTVLNTDIIANGSISNNATDAVRVISRLGATHEMFLGNVAPPGILTNPLLMDGNAAASGIGIAIFAEDGGATTSVMRSELRNILLSNTGNGVGTSGILVSGEGNSQTDFIAENIEHAGSNGGDAIRFDFNTNNSLVNSVNMNEIELTGISANGIVATLTDQSTVDFVFNNISAIGNQTTGGGGFVYLAGGSSLSRLEMLNSEFSSFNLDGISIDSLGNARVFATLERNIAEDNGRSEPDPDTLPFEDGITISSLGNSQMTAIFRNNTARENFERGFSGFAGGTSRMVTLFEFNSFTNNDLGEDANNDPIVDSGLEDFELTNGLTATSATALSNNFFALDATIASLGAAADFTVELDGNTNQIPPTLINVTPTPFGTVVAPAIAAEEAFFSAAGFP